MASDDDASQQGREDFQSLTTDLEPFACHHPLLKFGEVGYNGPAGFMWDFAYIYDKLFALGERKQRSKIVKELQEQCCEGQHLSREDLHLQKGRRLANFPKQNCPWWTMVELDMIWHEQDVFNYYTIKFKCNHQHLLCRRGCLAIDAVSILLVLHFFLNLLDRSRTAAKRLTLRNNVTDVGMLVTQEARRCDGLQSAVFSWWLSDESSAYREVARLSLMVWKTSSQNSGSIMASTVELDGQGRKWATSGRRHFHQRSWGAILDGFTHVLCQFCQLLQDGPFIPTASQVFHR